MKFYPPKNPPFAPYTPLFSASSNPLIPRAWKRLTSLTNATSFTLAVGRFHCPFWIARLTTGATDSEEMFRSWQYRETSQSDTRFWPLLALQPRQQSAMFSLVMIVASLIICSQLGADLVETSGAVKSFPQYTQTLSRSRTSSSNQSGIFHLFVIEPPRIFAERNDASNVSPSRAWKRHKIHPAFIRCTIKSRVFRGHPQMVCRRHVAPQTPTPSTRTHKPKRNRKTRAERRCAGR